MDINQDYKKDTLKDGTLSEQQSIQIDELLSKLPRKYDWIISWLFGSFCMFVILYLMQFLFNGKYVILEGDLFEVYVPAIREFCRSVREGQNIFYTWSSFLGDSTSAYYAFSAYSFTNLLFLFFPNADSADLVCIAMIIKSGLACGTFTYFAQRILKTSRVTGIFFGLFYGLCAYQVSFNLTNFIWMDSLFMLPLIITFICLAIDEGKWLRLILAYAYLFISNFYLAYMIGIFSCIFMILYLFLFAKHDERRTTGQILKKLFTYAGSVLLAIGMTTVVLLPAAYFLLVSNVTVDATPFSDILINPLDIYNQLFWGENNGMEGFFPYIYCGIPAMLLTIFYFIDRNVLLKEKLTAFGLLLLWILSCLINPLYQFWHMFDAPDSWNYRFSFIISFILCTLACREVPNLKRITWLKCVVIVILNGIAYFAAMQIQQNKYAYYSSNSIKLLIVNVVIMAVWILITWFCVHHRSTEKNRILYSGLLLFLAMIEIVGNGIYAYLGRTDTKPSIQRDYYNTWEASQESMLAQLSEDDSFYRVNYKNDYIHNSDTFYGYNGISDFSSMENYKVRKCMEALGLYTSTRICYSFGLTPVTKMLFDVKYDVDGINPYDTSYDTHLLANNNTTYQTYGNDAGISGNYIPSITENEHVLSLGYMVNPEFEDFSFSSRNIFSNMNELLSAMTGNEIDAFDLVSSNQVSVNEIGITLTQMEEGYWLSGAQETSGIKAIQYIIPSNEKEAYSAFDCGISNTINGCPYFYGGEENTVFKSGLFGTLYAKKMDISGEYNATTICMDDGTYQDVMYQNAYFAYYNEDGLEDAYDNLSVEQLNVETYENGYVKANITVESNNHLLFTTIPYITGWTAYIDGIKADIIPLLDDTFIGLNVSPGYHEIELVYTAPCVKTGSFISIIAVLVFIGISTYFVVNSYKKRNI